MTLNLVLNNNNVVSGSNNTRYRYKFTAPLEIQDEAEMTIANITMPYSWFNITKVNQNNSFTFYFPNASSLNLTMPDGYYSVDDINAYIQQQCIANGRYLINESGENVFYFTLLYNPTYYAVQIIAQLVPTSLPTNWSVPSGWSGFPATSLCPYINIPSTSKLGTIIGYSNNANYPSTNTANASLLSTLVPQGSIVNSLIIRSNIIDNDSGFPTDVLDTMPITSSFGTNINYTPTTLKWVKCTAGTFQSFDVFFSDQNLNPMFILDNNVCISILLKNKGKIISSNINGEETEGRSQKLVQRLALKLEE
jgi:hypothetical protein